MIAMKLLIFVTEFYWFQWRLSSMLLLLLYRKMYFIWFWSHKNQFKIGHNFECYSTKSFVFVESFSFWLMIPKYKSWEQIMWCTPCVCSFLIHFKWNWSELDSCTRKQRNWTDLQVKESTTEQCYGVKKSVVGRCLSPPSTFQCFCGTTALILFLVALLRICALARTPCCPHPHALCMSKYMFDHWLM